MKKVFNKWWIWLIASVLFLLIIQVLFTLQAPYKWMEATWEAGDLISFVGTMVLGYIAIHQTEQANLMSKKLMDIEENQYKIDIQPFVVVIDWRVYEFEHTQMLMNADNKRYVCIGAYGDGETFGLALRLLNTTSSYVTVEYFRGITERNSWDNICVNQMNRKIYIKPNDSEEIILYASANFIRSLENKKSTISFILENRFGQRYKETFELYIIYLNSDYVSKKNEMRCSAIIQNYKIIEC